MFKKISMCFLIFTLLFFCNLVFSNDIQPNINIENLYSRLISEDRMIQNDAVKETISFGEKVIPLLLKKEDFYKKKYRKNIKMSRLYVGRFWKSLRQILDYFIISDVQKGDFKFIVKFTNKKELEKLGFKQGKIRSHGYEMRWFCNTVKKNLRNQQYHLFCEAIYRAHKNITEEFYGNYIYLLKTASELDGHNAFPYFVKIYEETEIFDIKVLVLNLIITNMQGANIEKYILTLIEKNDPFFYCLRSTDQKKFRKNLLRFSHSFKIALKNIIDQKEKDKYLPYKCMDRHGRAKSIYHPYLKTVVIYHDLDKKAAYPYFKKILYDNRFSISQKMGIACSHFEDGHEDEALPILLEYLNKPDNELSINQRINIAYFLFDKGHQDQALPVILEDLSKEYFYLDGVFKRLSKTNDARIIPYLINYINRSEPFIYKLAWLNPYYWILRFKLKMMGDDVPTSNKKAAARILRKLTGQNYTYKQGRAWKKWWKRNRTK